MVTGHEMENNPQLTPTVLTRSEYLFHPYYSCSTYYLEYSHSTSFNVLSKLSTFPTHVPQSVFTLNVTVLQAVLLSQPPVVKITKHVSIDVTTVAFLCYVGRHRHGDGGNFVQRVSPTVVVVQNVLGVSTPHLVSYPTR